MPLVENHCLSRIGVYLRVSCGEGRHPNKISILPARKEGLNMLEVTRVKQCMLHVTC